VRGGLGAPPWGGRGPLATRRTPRGGARSFIAGGGRVGHAWSPPASTVNRLICKGSAENRLGARGLGRAHHREHFLFQNSSARPAVPDLGGRAGTGRERGRGSPARVGLGFRLGAPGRGETRLAEDFFMEKGRGGRESEGFPNGPAPGSSGRPGVGVFRSGGGGAGAGGDARGGTKPLRGPAVFFCSFLPAAEAKTVLGRRGGGSGVVRAGGGPAVISAGLQKNGPCVRVGQEKASKEEDFPRDTSIHWAWASTRHLAKN